MTIDDTTKEDKLQYNIKREAAKFQRYCLERLIHMNILQVKKYYHLIEAK